jgi:hypothetical protein
MDEGHWKTGPVELFFEHLDEWRKLVDEGYRSHPLLQAEFLRPAINRFGEDITAAIYVRDDQINAIGLFTQASAGIWHTFDPSQLPLMPLVFSEGVEIGEILNILPRHLSRTALVVSLLHNDPRYCISQLTDFTTIAKIPSSETMTIEVDGTFQDYVSSRSKRLRKNIKRYDRKLAEQFSEVSLNLITEPERVPAAVARYGEIESAGWKGELGTAIHADNVQGAFYRDVLTAFAKRGEAYVYELIADGLVIASRLAIASNSIMVILKTAYLEQHRALAPGRLLLLHVIEDIFSHRRAGTIEFYTKVSEGQRQWGTHFRELYHQEVFRGRVVMETAKVVRSIRSMVTPNV